MFKNRFLSSTRVFFAPPDEGGVDGPDDGDDRIPEPDLEDDETVGDPEGESDEDDQEDDDDQGDDQEDDQGGGQDDDRAAARPSRGDRQVAALRAERRRLADENARLTRQLSEAARAPQQSQQPQETPQQRAERLALMSPEERTEVMVNEALARHSQQQQVITNQLLDQSDRASFDTLCAGNPLLKKLAPEVERRRNELIQRDGNYVPRGVVATYLVGERVLAQQGKAKPGAQRRQRQQQTRPVNGGGDRPTDRRERSRASAGSAEDMEARFGDVPI